MPRPVTVSSRMQVIIVPRRPADVPNNGWSKPHNLLVALDLKKQGYQIWAVGGTTGDNPALAGAFFLGPPLAAGRPALRAGRDQLAKSAWSASAPKTGALEWKQQLAVVEDNQQIIIDRVRRLAGASPSYADGVLICPTSAGAVVAVDLATRSLRWGYQYPRWDLVHRTSGAFGVRASFAQSTTRRRATGSTAPRPSPTAGSILTPVESQELHCLDLLDRQGQLAGPAARRDALRRLRPSGARSSSSARTRCKAIKLADGKPAWTAPIDLGNETPSRPRLLHRQVLLPAGQRTSSSPRSTWTRGKIVARAKTEIDLGNVVCYKDQLITQSAQHVGVVLPHRAAAWPGSTRR